MSITLEKTELPRSGVAEFKSVPRGKFSLVDQHGNVAEIIKGAIMVDSNEHHTAFNEEYTADGSGNISATVIITPASATNHLGIHGFQIISDGASGSIALDFATSGEKVVRIYLSKTSALASSEDHTEGADNEGLTFTATGIGSGSKVFLKVLYVDHAGNGD